MTFFKIVTGKPDVLLFIYPINMLEFKFLSSRSAGCLRIIAAMLLGVGLLSDVILADNLLPQWSSEGTIPEPIEVIAKATPKTIGGQNGLEVSVYGRLKESQYIYSGESQGDPAPIPTSIELDHPLFAKKGTVMESRTVQIRDTHFDRVLKVHRQEFQMRQKFTMKRLPLGENLVVGGYLLYQQCTGRLCSLPTKSHFEIVVAVAD